MNTVSIGAVPLYEAVPENRAEHIKFALAFQRQVIRHYGLPPSGAYLHISISRGGVTDLAITYDPDNRVAAGYALSVIMDTGAYLTRWDRQAREEVCPPMPEPKWHSVWQAL